MAEETSRLDSTITKGVQNGVSGIESLALRIKRQWQNEGKPDATAAFDLHPELRHFRSLAIDLAHEEYDLRTKGGEPIDTEEFCGQFPSLQQSLFMMIEVEKLLETDPRYQELCQTIVWPEIGDRVMGFTIEGTLGEGRFGKVFLARQDAVGDRIVALKLAPQGGEEAQMLGRLEHPCIVPIHSVHLDESSGLTGVCMPYLGRATLADLRDEVFAQTTPPRRGQFIANIIHQARDEYASSGVAALPSVFSRGPYVNAVLHLAVQMAEGLDHAHRRGICHRDLKPSNVLLANDGRPMLLDFNLAMDTGVEATRFGGTLPYMAPEHTRAVVIEPSTVHPDPRSDLFSLGVVLYELLAGCHPFGGVDWGRSLEETAEELVRRQEGPPLSITETNPEVDTRLARIVEQCLAFEPDDRPATADALAASFRRQLSTFNRSRRWVRRHLHGVLLSGTLVVLLLAAWMTYLILRPSYPVRQYQEGKRFVEQGQYRQAVDHLNRALWEDPEYGDALLERGKAYAKLGKYSAAFDDFHAVYTSTKSPEVSGYRAYCLSRLDHHEEALDSYRIAIDAGTRSAAVFNNEALSMLKKERWTEAEACLLNALELDPTLLAAHRNLALVYVNLAVEETPVDQQMLDRVESAVAVCPPSADLYLQSAVLTALAARNGTIDAQTAIKYVALAVRCGCEPEKIVSHPAFASLSSSPAFHDALRSSMDTPATDSLDRLVEPF